jgi:putative aldouronate transport system substrate-binding protein
MTEGSPRISRRALLGAGMAGAGVLGGLPLLSGCSSSGGGNSGGNSGSKPTGAPLELGAEVKGPHYKPGYVGPRTTVKKPFDDGKTTFRVVVPQDSTVVGDWNKNKTTDWFEKRTGVKIQFQEVLITNPNGGNDLTKVNAMLSSGDLPDAFMGIPFTPAQVSLYGQQGTFVALDDLIAHYAPETRQAMKDYPDLRPLKASTNGKMYQMPGVNDCFHCRSSPGRAWINKPYLDAIGMQVPESTDELRQVLLEFKNKNPSKKSGFVPFASGVNNPLDTFFMQPFLYTTTGDQNGGWMRLNSGKVEFTPTLDEWRDALRYLRQLNKDGTLTAQNFSMADTELQTAGNKSMIGFARVYWWGSMFNPVTLDKNAPWRDYVVVPPLKGPSGNRTAMWDYYGFATNGLQITSACKDPATLVQWSDYQMDLESIMWEYDGIKDSNWKWAPEGSKGIDGGSALFRDVQWPAPQGQSWNQYATMYRSLDFRGGQYVDPKAPTYEAGLYAAGKQYEPFAQSKDMQLPPVIIPDDSASQVADTATSIQQQVKQGMSNFALGKKDIESDSDWQAYVGAFNGMNLKAYLDIYQKAYDTRPK